MSIMLPPSSIVAAFSTLTTRMLSEINVEFIQHELFPVGPVSASWKSNDKLLVCIALLTHRRQFFKELC